MSQKTFAIIAVALVLAAGVGGAVLLLKDDGSEPSKYSYEVDAVGRDLEIPADLNDGIITMGSIGPMRFLSVFDVFDKIIETDKGDANEPKHGRGYSYAFDLNTEGRGGEGVRIHTDNKLVAEDIEKIGKNPASLIVMSKKVYSSAPDLAEVLDGKYNLLVIHDQTWTEFFDADFKVSDLYKCNITLIGKVLKMEDRASAHLNAIQGIFDDIRSHVGDNPGKTYVAGLTKGGSNELDVTFPYYMPLNLTGGQNSVSGSSSDGKLDIGEEKAVDVISGCKRVLIDPSSCDKFSTEPSQMVLNGIYDINNDSDPSNDVKLYVTFPIVWDHLNYDCILAGSYYLLQLQYGCFTDAELNSKIASVFEEFYGERGAKVVPGMTAFFEEKTSTYDVQLPLMSEVEVVKNGNVYTTVAVA